MQYFITLTGTFSIARLTLNTAGVQPQCVAADGQIVVRVVDGDGNVTPARA